MKLYKNKELSKKIIFAILIVMIFNFISPTVSQADFGGALFKPILDFIAGVADLVLELLHEYFLGDSNFLGEIDEDATGGAGEFSEIFVRIRYSPGIIFSNGVPALQTNFISGISTMNTTKTTVHAEQIATGYSLDEVAEMLDCTYEYIEDPIYTDVGYNAFDGVYPMEVEYHYTLFTSNSDDYTIEVFSVNSDPDYWHWLYSWLTDGIAMIGDGIVTLGGNIFGFGDYVEWNWLENFEYSGGWVHFAKYTTYENITLKTSTGYLSPIVSNWYVGFRGFTLVALLSVVVYIGIRIIISSTGQDKAKYKKMLLDWIVAIALVFVLHYLMLFITKTSEYIINIVSDGTLYVDEFMSEMRSRYTYESEFKEEFKYLLIYVVLVIYSVIFTLQYLRRMLYLAFFTMIAPLVAFTYPLDRIKDGQAQAFSVWFREYLFNSLIQPVHLVLYVMLIDSTQAFVTANPIYAIVAIGFLIPAEKFFRKMFGFDKASSVGQSGAAAAAGGALVMNAINKLGQGVGKGAGQSGGGQSMPGGKGGEVRTNDGSALSALSGGNNSAPGKNKNANTKGGANSSNSGAKRFAAAGGRAIKGIANVANNQLFTRKAVQRNLGALGKVGGAVGGALVGSATGIVTGDPSNVLKYGTTGALGGAAATGGLVNKGFNAYDSVKQGASSLAYDYDKGAYGEDEAQRRQFDRQFKKSEDYKKMLKKYSKNPNIRNDIQSMLNAGITDTNRMNTILENMDKYKTDLPHAMAYNQLANDCGDSVLYDDKKLRMFLNKRGINISNNSDLDRLRQSIIDFK